MDRKNFLQKVGIAAGSSAVLSMASRMPVSASVADNNLQKRVSAIEGNLSDAGKDFKFGYNASTDAYGYYKDGVFTQFGGGGLSTKCIVKSCVFFPAFNNVSGAIPFNVYVLNQDGSFYTTSVTSNISQTVGNFVVSHSDFISNIEWWTPEGTYYGTPQYITFSKDGYYSLLGLTKTGASSHCDPTFYSAGSKAFTTGFGSAVGFGVINLGMEVPS